MINVSVLDVTYYTYRIINDIEFLKNLEIRQQFLVLISVQ